MKKQNSKKLNLVSKTSLSEKQSVRTTFKLSENSKNVIERLIRTNNLKPKELFDLICSSDVFVDLAIEAAKKNDESASKKQTRKTFVISKQVLRLLNKHSKQYKLSRDLIVENLILLFKSLSEKHAEEEKQREEKALTIISDFWGKAESVEKQLKDLLSDNNPILFRFGNVIVLLMNLVGAIKSKLSNGVPVDPDEM